jgi:putative transposase-like DNA-binding protein
MSRYRLAPSPAQDATLREHCAHARFVRNLCVEQEAEWRPGRGKMPRFAERCRQLSAARADSPWLAGGSVIVQQQAVRDHDDVKSFRVTLDRAGRWHVAFAAIPEPIPAPGNGEVIGIDRGVVVSAALSTGETLSAPRLSHGTVEQPGKNVRQKAGLNRGIAASGWGQMVSRLEQKAPGRVEKVSPVYTSQRCSACGHVDRHSRESQARFRCTACGFACHADVNAAINIAAGHAVTARGGSGLPGPVNRELQPVLLPAARNGLESVAFRRGTMSRSDRIVPVREPVFQ